MPATTVDIRNANKRPRGKGGRAISSSIKETQSNTITTMTTEKRERGWRWSWVENSWISFLSPIHSWALFWDFRNHSARNIQMPWPERR